MPGGGSFKCDRCAQVIASAPHLKQGMRLTLLRFFEKPPENFAAHDFQRQLEVEHGESMSLQLHFIPSIPAVGSLTVATCQSFFFL
jgi:hypothetical protein